MLASTRRSYGRTLVCAVHIFGIGSPALDGAQRYHSIALVESRSCPSRDREPQGQPVSRKAQPVLYSLKWLPWRTTPRWTLYSSRAARPAALCPPVTHSRTAHNRTPCCASIRLPDALVSGAAQAPPQETHLDPELQDLRQQLNYKNAEATNLRTNLAAVQSELAAAKIAAARGASSGGGRQDGEASRLRREIQQLRTKLEFAEQARREMQHPPTAPQVPQRHTTAVQTDRAEHPCAMTSALFFPSFLHAPRALVRARNHLSTNGWILCCAG